MVNVRYYFREYRKGGLSIEGIFNIVKECNKSKANIDEYHLNPAISRIANIFEARKNSTGINHITGDVYFLAIGFKGSRNIITIHDLGHYEHLRYNKIKQLIYRYVWLYIPFRKAAVITVVSEFTRQKMLQFFPFTERKIKLIPNPVKPLFKYDHKEQLNAIPRILQIGTGKHKNLLSLVLAVKNMPVHLDIVADIEDDVLAILKDNNISYTRHGRLSDEEMLSLYKEIDVLFFASFYEGFGMPIIEAQAIGRPVITSNIGAMKEVAGDTAVLVNPSNTEEINIAINNLITDMGLYSSMVKLGVKNAAKYSADIIAEQYLSIYKELDQR